MNLDPSNVIVAICKLDGQRPSLSESSPQISRYLESGPSCFEVYFPSKTSSPPSEAMWLVICLVLLLVVEIHGSYLRTESDWNLEAQNPEFFASRQRMLRVLDEKDEHHPKSWSVLAEVNGLKNTEVAVFITSSTNGNDHFLWDRIIPSSRTWMRLFANVFVIVEGEQYYNCHYFWYYSLPNNNRQCVDSLRSAPVPLPRFPIPHDVFVS